MEINKEKMDEVYRLIGTRRKLTIIQLIGIGILLGIQVALAPFVPSVIPTEVMVFYPLLLLAWGVFILVGIFKINAKINKLTQEITDDVRKRRNPSAET